MTMYTRCPSCRSEIAFEAPSNIANLPEDYKHRIKCPCCGVTIGVKLNKIERQPVNETPLTLQPLEEAPVQEQPVTVPARSLEKQTSKRPGTGRNVLMMIVSLLFIAVSVIGYLALSEKIKLGYGFDYNDGIAGWETLVRHFSDFKAMFQEDALYGILYIIPMISFTIACITFVVALISACGKKYGRAFNLIWAILALAAGVMVLFAPMLMGNMLLPDGVEKIGLGEYFKSITENKSYAIFIPAALGLIQLIFALIFTKSLEEKQKD